jgi:RNA polymerase sigma factor (TIGR02999 family)
VTRLLRLVQQGNVPATEQLAELVQADLRRMAAKFLAGERDAHSLQPTALVHEAWLRVMPDANGRSGGPPGGVQGRGHFMAIAARAMRQILVDHARAHRSQKRGGEWQRVTLSDDLPGTDPQAALVQLLDLHNALESLAVDYPRPAQVVELRAFGGLTILEAADSLGVSCSTVEDDWTFAKGWLSRALRPG